MGFNPFVPATSGLAEQTLTPAAGFALQNATPTIATWTAPSDSNAHVIVLFGAQDITSILTGGAVGVTGTLPDGTSFSFPVFGNTAVGAYRPNQAVYIVKAGSVFSVAQTSAMTAGASIVWFSMWAA